MKVGLRTAITVTMTAVVAFAAVPPVRSGEDSPPAVDLDRQVRALLSDLGAATRATRSAAEARLLELGPSVLPHLPAPELLPTVSVREAVDRIRRDLERRHARESVLASRVALQGTRPLGEWLVEIQKQTRNALDASLLPPPLLARPTTLEIPDREFWPALDELASLAGFAFESDPNRRGLRLRPAPAAEKGSPPTAYAGPFRFTARPVEIVPVGARRDGLGRRLARAVLFVQAEPRLRPLFIQFAAADIAATSGKSTRLDPFSPEASYELPAGDAGSPARMQLDYLLPAGPPAGPLSLHGTIRVTTAADRAEVRFVEVTANPDGKPIGIDRRRGGVNVSLQRVRREKTPAGRSEFRVQVAVAYDSGGPAFESHRSWLLNNEVFLETPDGKRLALNGGYDMTLQADGVVGMEYRFVDLPAPLPDYAFVYVAPTLIIDVPVEFALKSVPFEVAK